MKFRDFKEKIAALPFFTADISVFLKEPALSFRPQLTRWKKRGWVMGLGRGMYVLAHGERRTVASLEVLAGHLYTPSYISLESALSWHRLIPEKVQAVTCVTTRKTRTFENSCGVFQYRSLKTALFFGYVLVKDAGGFGYFMAEKEKALLDYLYLNLGSIRAEDRDYFKGALRLQNVKSLDRRKLKLYAARFGLKKLDRILEPLL